MSAAYDLAVIGGGSAGIPAAQLAAGIGARVLLIEAERVGGDCTWTGCVPSKALLHAAHTAHAMRTADSVGIEAASPQVDLGRVMDRVQEAIDRVYAQETPEELAGQGIEVLIGKARFIDPHTLRAGDRQIGAKRVLICTGAAPEEPRIRGLAETPHLTYLDVYGLRRLPRRLAVLGAGAVGCEMAQAFQRLGSQVTLIEAAGRILPSAEPELSSILTEQFAEDGMSVMTGTAPTSVGTLHDGVTLTVGEQEVAADQLLVATGRLPRLDSLDLERAGVTATAAGIEVDAHLRTSQAHIYAAGDVAGGFQFTHYAGWQGFQAARNALLPGGATGKRENVPWAIFTQPEIAQVGQSREQAERQGSTEVHVWPLERLDRAQAQGEHRGRLQVLTHNGVVVGASVALATGGEIINELAVAVEQKLKLTDLASIIHVYPTHAFGIQQLGARAAVAKAFSGIGGRVIRTLVR